MLNFTPRADGFDINSAMLPEGNFVAGMMNWPAVPSPLTHSLDVGGTYFVSQVDGNTIIRKCTKVGRFLYMIL